ncbi:type I restriction-modification system, methyltransferase subunit [Corynebacterium pilosum]|uniref:site-specific DNA-methyltransferase (adenine-specific) n=2 Tax=Corynebacterium pilosum TaxID=35756 RepID=A0A376CL28_9CORY|nr:type I restriction-modification system, methyltransferase subunit [Corynebacterium pilosum]
MPSPELAVMPAPSMPPSPTISGRSITLNTMITGALKSKVDRIWDTFWSGGISNPTTVIEQFTYLLFIKQLDDQQNDITLRKQLGDPNAPDDIFSENQQHLRWRNLMQLKDEELKQTINDEVFPFIRAGLGSEGFARHMERASFGIDNEGTLASVMQQINDLNFSNRDIAGDLYEYMLSKLATSGTNGQFRTPSHIVDLMVALMQPTPSDKIIDPAAGTAGFLVGASDWIRQNHKDDLADKRIREDFFANGLTGYDFDATMVRIAAMNLYMHGFQNPNISYRDSLQQIPDAEKEIYDMILANPPFSGSIDQKKLDPDLSSLFSTKKTELLFVARFLSLLKPGGRAAVIVPEGVLFGSTKAHKALRKELVERQQLDAVIKLPSGTFKPYSGVSTAILCFTRADHEGATDGVWFYEVRADGRSLDDKRTPLLDEHLLGPLPTERPRDSDNINDNPPLVPLSDEQLAHNNLPDTLARFRDRDGAEKERERTEQSFIVPVDEIREADYDLSMNRYKEIVLDAEETRNPLEILAEIKELDTKISSGLADLEAMLKGGQS